MIAMQNATDAFFLCVCDFRYERRGISLAFFDGDRPEPHLVTLDRDPFRNKRLVYFLKPGKFTDFTLALSSLLLVLLLLLLPPLPPPLPLLLLLLARVSEVLSLRRRRR